MGEQDTDHELVKRVQAGDSRAFDLLVAPEPAEGEEEETPAVTYARMRSGQLSDQDRQWPDFGGKA